MKSIELFCGTGGLALGLQEAGFRHHALYEWDTDSCTNIQQNIIDGFYGVQDWNVIQTDVRDVDFTQLQKVIKMVSGGPPCQPFSFGGKSNAHNDPRDMFPQAVRAVREIQPDVFIFENVKGLLRKAFEPYFSYIIYQLQYPSIVRQDGMSWEDHRAVLEKHHKSTNGSHCEYDVQFRLLNAADYGVPQIRYRVFIVGFRHSLESTWSFPNPTHSKEMLSYSKWITCEYWNKHGLMKPQCDLEEKGKQKLFNLKETTLLPWKTVRDAIGNLPDPQSEEAKKYNNHVLRDGARSYHGHSGSSLDEPSKTIKAGAHGVPGGENTVILDNGEIRYYTVRESARIQTFPDDYRFYSSWTESMRQIGNAVPVLLAKAVGSSIIEYIGGNNNAKA